MTRQDELKIMMLKPDFRPIVIRVMKRLEDEGWQPKVYEGLRTQAQQREKVRKGYSKTMRSYHLSGYAVDIADKRYAWNVTRVHPFWHAYAKAIFDEAKNNPGLGWGGIWSGGILDTFKETSRWKKYEAAVEKGRDDLTWFVDVAHMELRRR